MKRPYGLNMPRRSAGVAALTLAAVLLAGGCARDTAIAPAARMAARTQILEDAWFFACSITNDVKDRTRSQYDVAHAWLEADDPDRCLVAAKQIDGWQQLALFADAAALWAERGETNKALPALAEAEYRAPGVQDWPFDRIQMHVGRAKAFLGRRSELKQLAEAYARNRDHKGTTICLLALEAARAGEVDAAVAYLDQLSDSTEFDTMVSRASGFGELAATGRVPTERMQALYRRSWEEIGRVPGWRRTDLQLDLVDRVREAHLGAQASNWLAAATEELLAVGYPAHILGPRLGQAARRWGMAGDTGTVVRLEAAYRKDCAAGLELIEQPAILAHFAEAFWKAGDRTRAEALFAEALELSGKLLNPRPRALACVSVMLSLARCEGAQNLSFDQRRTLLAGFEVRDP